jgi:hypothetical protein
MYNSDLNKPGKVFLTAAELTQLKDLLGEIGPVKLTISGGGEPFLQFNQCLDLVSAGVTNDIEIITAGHWATSQARCQRVFSDLAAATKKGLPNTRCGIRVSLDSFHRSAPRPVTGKQYSNIVRAFGAASAEAQELTPLSFRGLLRERNETETYLAELVDARVEHIDEWNSEVFLNANEPSLKITYNVMRFSGAAAANQLPRLPEDVSMMQYFMKHADQPALKLSQAINDASRGAYTFNPAAAITIDSDGSLFIFAASPPDRLGELGWRLSEIRDFFSLDPLTQWLYHLGPLPLLRFMQSLAPQRSALALATEDITSLVPTLLGDPLERTAARLEAVKELCMAGFVREIGPAYRRYSDALA